MIGDEAARYSVRRRFRPLTAIVSSRYYFISWKSHSREKENRTVDSSSGLFFFFFNLLKPIVREHAAPLFPFIRPILRKLKVLRPGRRWQPKRELGRERSSGNKSNKLRYSVRNSLAHGSEDFLTLSFFSFLSCRIFSVSLYVFCIPTSFYREPLSSCFFLVRFLGQIIAISLNVRYEQPIRRKWLKYRWNFKGDYLFFGSLFAGKISVCFLNVRNVPFFFRSIIFTLLMSAIGVRSSLVDRISRKMLESRTDKWNEMAVNRYHVTLSS